MSPAERLAWLRLARAETVGPVAFRHLIQRYGSAAKALGALPALAARGGSSRSPRIPSEADALAELEAGEALGARLLCVGLGRDAGAAGRAAPGGQGRQRP